jgi:hypothetical protein
MSQVLKDTLLIKYFKKSYIFSKKNEAPYSQQILKNYIICIWKKEEDITISYLIMFLRDSRHLDKNSKH